MQCKWPPVPGYFQMMDDFFSHLKLDADTPYEPIAPALQSSRSVPKQPIHASTWVGVPQRTAPDPLHHIEKALETLPEGAEMKPPTIAEVIVQMKKEWGMIRTNRR
jgi:hypothetical protein